MILMKVKKVPKKQMKKLKDREWWWFKCRKIYNFSLFKYKNIFLSTLQLEKVESDLCIKYGKLTLAGRFDIDIKKEYDFELPLS
jgi:hypothetical protein